MKEGMHIFKTNDLDYIARRTYSCKCKILRLTQLFKKIPIQHIFQIDCDTILRNGFHTADFRQLTKYVSVMPQPKDPGVFIASALSLGIEDKGMQFRDPSWYTDDRSI